MTWDKPITADGCTATPEQMQAAWASWIGDGCGRGGHLAKALTRAGVTGTNRFYPTERVADRMLQRARKAGAIRYVKGRWEIVPQPNPAA